MIDVQIRESFPTLHDRVHEALECVALLFTIQGPKRVIPVRHNPAEQVLHPAFSSERVTFDIEEDVTS